MSRTAAVLAVLGAVGFACVSAAPAASLKASDIVNRKGDGKDAKGNTDDDTWQFWWQEVVHRKYHHFNSFYRHKKYDGWSHNHDMDTDFEGVWGNIKTGQVFAHPYVEKNAHRAVAITYKVPAAGAYDISGGVTDVKVVKHRLHTGILWRVEIATGGAKGRVVGKGGPIGDKVGPDSATFSIPNVRVKKGELVRLVIDPNKWWGSDMTRIDSFRIVPATTKPAATKPATTQPAATKPATTKPATTKPATTKPAESAAPPAVGGASLRQDSDGR